MKNLLDLSHSSLLIVDAQCGFSEICPDELPVPGAIEIVPVINRLLVWPWSRVDTSLDWHPADHCSFIGQRDNLWPPHCVMGTRGAEFLPGLKTDEIGTMWRKGFLPDMEAYSLSTQHPGFAALLKHEGIKTIAICGLATNICCFHEAKALRSMGLDVQIIEDATRGIDVPDAGISQEKTKAEGQSLGIQYVQSSELYVNSD